MCEEVQHTTCHLNMILEQEGDQPIAADKRGVPGRERKDGKKGGSEGGRKGRREGGRRE